MKSKKPTSNNINSYKVVMYSYTRPNKWTLMITSIKSISWKGTTIFRNK